MPHSAREAGRPHVDRSFVLGDGGSLLTDNPKTKQVTELSVTCFSIQRRGRDSNPRNSCPFTAFRVRPDRPLRHLSFFCGANIRTFFQNASAKPSFFCALNNKYIVRKVQKSQKNLPQFTQPMHLIHQPYFNSRPSATIVV